MPVCLPRGIRALKAILVAVVLVAVGEFSSPLGHAECHQPEVQPRAEHVARSACVGKAKGGGVGTGGGEGYIGTRDPINLRCSGAPYNC